MAYTTDIKPDGDTTERFVARLDRRVRRCNLRDNVPDSTASISMRVTAVLRFRRSETLPSAGSRVGTKRNKKCTSVSTPTPPPSFPPPSPSPRSSLRRPLTQVMTSCSGAPTIYEARDRGESKVPGYARVCVCNNVLTIYTAVIDRLARLFSEAYVNVKFKNDLKLEIIL
ncbi:hypothetical protein ACS0PU_005045 [Formica fusca]